MYAHFSIRLKRGNIGLSILLISLDGCHYRCRVLRDLISTISYLQFIFEEQLNGEEPGHT
jgi:hypothetical protein